MVMKSGNTSQKDYDIFKNNPLSTVHAYSSNSFFKILKIPWANPFIRNVRGSYQALDIA